LRVTHENLKARDPAFVARNVPQEHRGEVVQFARQLRSILGTR
jgi:hypothetical protein